MSLDYLIRRWDRVWELTLDHLTLAGTAILVALVIAIPLGILAARMPRFSTPLLAFLGALYTIPSLAFLALLIPTLGIGRRPAIVVAATSRLTRAGRRGTCGDRHPSGVMASACLTASLRRLRSLAMYPPFS